MLRWLSRGKGGGSANTLGSRVESLKILLVGVENVRPTDSTRSTREER
jgi:hypothetical protein